MASPQTQPFAAARAGPGPLQRLAIQAAASPRVTRLAQLQRRANDGVVQCNGDDWALAGNVGNRQAIDTTAEGSAFAFVEDHGDEAGFGSTLHHHISRFTMSSVCEAYKASQRRASGMTGRRNRAAKQELEEALGAFDSLVKTILNYSDLETPSMEKALHNLPLNLHYGPSIVKGDPGTGFDPSTRPVEGSETGERELEPISASLKVFDDTFRAAVDRETDGDSMALSTETWVSLNAALSSAFKAYKASEDVVSGIPFHPEEWAGRDGSDTHAKKGIGLWPGADVAATRFAERTAPLAAAGNAGHLLVNLTIDDDDPLRLYLYYEGDLIQHTCNRHTFRHFDPLQIKVLNSFFAPNTTQAEVEAHGGSALTAISAHFSGKVNDEMDYTDAEAALNADFGDDGLELLLGEYGLKLIRTEAPGDPDPYPDKSFKLVSMYPAGGRSENFSAEVLAALNL